jgi:hypothetical protein
MRHSGTESSQARLPLACLSQFGKIRLVPVDGFGLTTRRIAMKRWMSTLLVAGGLSLSSGGSAEAFWRTRIVYRPARTVVVQPAYVAPIVPVTTVVAPAPRVVYTPAYYAPAPVYVAPAPVAVYYGW